MKYLLALLISACACLGQQTFLGQWNAVLISSTTFQTNAWAGPTNVISLTNHASFITLSDCSITGVSGYSAGEIRTGFVNIRNGSGNDTNLTFTGSITLAGGGNTAVMTNGQVVAVAVQVDPWLNRTNAIVTSFP